VKTDHKIPVSAVSVSIKIHITRRVANVAFSNVILRNDSKKVKEGETENKMKNITHGISDNRISFFYAVW